MHYASTLALKRTLLVIAVLLSLSCSLFSQTSSPTLSPPHECEPTPVPVETSEPITVMEQSAVSASLDQIEVDYVYTSELITVLYPLYGDILDDFSIVTLTNSNNHNVRMVVESEIVGYSSMAFDTVDIEPYETIEIRQNPLLIPEVIDDLNAQKPAEFHLRVSYLEQGQKLQVLDQTHETLVTPGGTFPGRSKVSPQKRSMICWQPW